jgi:hypothetical protein
MGQLQTKTRQVLATQDWIEDKEIIIQTSTNGGEPTALEVSADFGHWLKLEISEIKNGRSYSRSIEIPKEQAEKFLENLQPLVKRMKTIEP